MSEQILNDMEITTYSPMISGSINPSLEDPNFKYIKISNEDDDWDSKGSIWGWRPDFNLVNEEIEKHGT